MAQTLISTSKSVKTVGGNSGYTFYMEVIMNSYDSASNYWNVTINHYGKGTGGYDYNSHPQPKSTISTTIDGTATTRKTTTVTAIGSSKKLIGTWTGNIGANPDGNKYVTFSCKYAPGASNSYLPKGNTITSSINMPTIPRYATVTTTTSNVTETTVNVNWSSNAAIKQYQYRLTYDGTTHSWVTVESNVNKTSGSYTISGLTPNKSYRIDFDYLRSDSGLWSYSAGYSGSSNITTRDYPYANSMPNFIIGNSVTLGFYNPLSRTITYELLDVSNNVVATGTTNSTTSGAITPTASTLYNSIPNKVSDTYKVKCTYGTNVYTKTGGTYSVNADTNKPNVSNCAGTYVADLTSLTNNNQTVINGASTITYTITNAATAQNGASISQYTINWGNATPVTISSISTSASLVKGTGNTISVTVKDSRGLTNTFTTALAEVVNYTLPTGLTMSPDRLNGVGDDVYLDVDGTIYYDKFGTNGVSNAITDVKYSVANETAQDISIPSIESYITYSSQSADTHTQKFKVDNAPIYTDGVSGGFDTTKTYTVTLKVYDKSGNYVTISGTVKDGKFAMIKGRDSNGDYHTGINGLPDNNCALKVHGTVIADNIPNEPYPVGSIYLSAIDTSPASIYGGTWTKIKGRYLYAINADTGTAGKDNMSTYTGAGSQSVTLTGAQSGIQKHNHGASGSYSGSDFYIRHGNSSGTATVANGWNTWIDTGVGTTWSNGFSTSSYSHKIDKVNIGGTVSVTVNDKSATNATEGHAHGISYVTLHVWQRTA